MPDAKTEEFDVIVVGGGPSGLFSAIFARERGARVLLVEKGNQLGRKLGISGGGRCNVTNAKPLPELMDNIPGNARFLHSALARFGNTDIMRFFEGLGIGLKEEDRGRVFPRSDKASTVVSALVNSVYERGVDVWTDTPVRGLCEEDGAVTGIRLANGKRVWAKAVILATGGCSVPKTGSTGDAYPWAKSAGHTIVDPYPTEVPLTSNDWFIRERTLQGLSLKAVPVTLWYNETKRLTVEEGDLIFTHFGLSGPVALRCSHYVSTSLRRKKSGNLTASVDALPLMASEALAETWRRWRRDEPRKQVGTLCRQILPDRLADVIIAETGIPSSSQVANLNNDMITRLVKNTKSFAVHITGTLPLSQATVTGGGVSVKEIDPRTMASKLVRGLYFCGEVMDVHAHTGGYNITVAFSTGHLAGESAAEFALDPVCFT